MGAIKKEFTVKSVSLMTGIESEARVCPSDEKGIRFHFNSECVKAEIENVVSAEHCTVIGNGRIKIMLIEHFMAACAFAGIDSIDVYLSHFELPILDGAAEIWLENFKNAGIVNADKKAVSVKEPVYYLNGKTHLIVLPSEELNLTYSVNYKHKDLKNRWAALDKNNLKEITEARTFGYLSELEAMQKAGFGRGASLENTLGLKDDGGYTAGLKSELEPVKHKILDLTGDFYLAGCNILNFKAQIDAKEAGHAVHIKLAKQLKDKLIMEA